MLELSSLYRLQESGANAGTIRAREVSFEDYVRECRTNITANLPESYSNGDWDAERKEKELDKLITNFVVTHKGTAVTGFIREDGQLNQNLLISNLRDVIAGEGVIKAALEDPDVDEIQINDYKTIFVVKKGVCQPYIDSEGRKVQFTNNMEVQMLIIKLIDDGTGTTPQFTDGAPLLNAKTAKKQYRLNAVHKVANARGLPPYDFEVTTVVIRKFKEVKLTFDDMIKGGSITPKIARFLKLVGRVRANTFFIGPTGSGKTTLLTAVCNTIPMSKRIIAVQNPTEVTFFDRDAVGANRRNALHWEAQDGLDEKKKNVNTMSNLISNSLRVTPDVIVIGEARTPDEFAQLQRAAQTGHRIIGTYHSEDSEGAISRGATELGTAMGTSGTEATKLWAACVDLIIVQYKYDDGDRKVLEITECLGTDQEGHPILRHIFHYVEDDAETDEKGVDHIIGHFEHCNPISEKLQKRLIKAGVSKATFAEFVEVKDKMAAID